MHPTIIIGAGLAGYTAAREFRKLDKSASLIIITADDGGFYSKPMLSNAFAQRKAAEQLITQSAANMVEQIGAVILTGTRVTGIDTSAKTVITSAGAYPYGKLVLAVGAQPIRLPLAGDGAADMHSINHLSDYAAFRTRIALLEQRGPVRVTILGAGLIGCEFADDLAGAGHRVTLIDPNPAPLAALAAPALSRGLKAALETRGVTLRLGVTAKRIDRSGGLLRVTLSNGAAFDTDIVLSAVGLRPELRLAQAAGLATGRGIIVDAFGRTSVPDVYALGDCAEYTHADGRTRTLPYIAPLLTAARAIARTLAGEPTAIDLKAAPVIVKTPCYPLALVPPPLHAVAGGLWETEQDGARMICRFYDSDGVMAGFGVTSQDPNVRMELLATLGTVKAFDKAA